MKFLFSSKIYLFILSVMMIITFAACSNDTKSKPSEHKKNNASSAVKKHASSGPEFLGGRVEETMSSGGYTYMYLSIGPDKIWVATPQMDVKVGDDVVLMPGNEMRNFTSKTLNRTFETIIFSPGPVGGGGSHGVTKSDMNITRAASHGQTVAPLNQDIKVEKAQGENTFTIAEIYEKADELNGKPVKVRGKIVKIASNIMGKTWIHIQDGTGTVEKGNFDLTVTTTDSPKKGDTVTATGTMHKDKDFGFGYHYNVIIEDASIENK